MRGLTESIVETAPFNPGNTESINIHLRGYVTQIIVRFHLKVTKASGAEDVQDGLLRLINGLRFTASNAKDWYSIRDGREGFYLSYIKSQSQCYLNPGDDGLPADLDEATDCYAQWTIHPGNLFGRQYDLTRCVPLRGKSNVQIQVDWGTAAADLGDNWSIDEDNSDGLSVIISRQVLNKGESEADAFSPLDYMMVPRLVPIQYPIDALYNAFGFSENIPTGAYVRDMAMLFLDSADDRSAGEISQFMISTNKGEHPFTRRNWQMYEREVMARYYGRTYVAGLGFLPFKDITGKDYGFNLVGASLGDYTLDMTTIATDGNLRGLYEMADMESVDPTVVGI